MQAASDVSKVGPQNLLIWRKIVWNIQFKYVFELGLYF